MSTASVKINLDLVPEHISKRLISDFACNYERFWTDPNNEAEFQQWKAEQSKKGGPS